MAFSENISLQNYADAANKKFGECESRLSQIEGSFETRMNGKTTGSLIGAMFATVCWTVAFFVFYGFINGYVDNTLRLVCLGIALALFITMFIDEIIGFSYYGKISSYKNNISQLKNRVSLGRSSIKSNRDTFMKSRSNGWRYSLSVGTSIPEETTSIESTINSMESLKGGFIQGLKNFLYYTFVIAITGLGSWALFGVAGEIMTGIYPDPIDYGTVNTLCTIGLVITVVGEIILAKMVWGKTDCSVTNTTLFIAAAGPLMFLALIAVATLIVILVMLAIAVVVAIAGVVIAVAFICGFIFGG